MPNSSLTTVRTMTPVAGSLSVIAAPGITARDGSVTVPRRTARPDCADAAPEFLVIHGANDTLARVDQAREFVRTLDAALPDHVTYLELPHTQHAFEVFGSIRARHVIRGVRRWLEWHRAQWLAGRSEADTSDVAASEAG